MQKSVIHIPSFQGQYKTGLIFAMVEGLKCGEGFRIVCDQDPSELEDLLKASEMSDLRWDVSQHHGRWEMSIQKVDRVESDNVGCCGMCHGKRNQSQQGN